MCDYTNGPSFSLRRDLDKLVLRAIDQGRINGEFEVYFFGAGLNQQDTQSPKVMRNITLDAWRSWNKKRKKITTQEKLDWEFAKHFRVRIPSKKHITQDMCDGWERKYEAFLVEIKTKRAEHKPGPRQGDPR